MQDGNDLEEVRAFHAKLMFLASGSNDARLERVFDSVRREAFVGPGPWQVMVNRRYAETPSSNPVYLYQNSLVALDAARGINNGEPFLHAAWLGAVAPKSGETIIQVGAGAGYYTAILSMLALPDGQVQAYEIDPELAQRATKNLAPFEGVTVITGDATCMGLPDCDLIYVNAGVVSPPASWLKALRPGGRIIFPWSPTADIGITLMMTRKDDGFAVRPLGPSRFISCVGASDPATCIKTPTPARTRTINAAWLMEERAPDAGAIAVCQDVWFATQAN
jgi:protein-L-isoaspartate(D-aspartate) O-methyltransferase